jgi:serine/threonine-protein kinase RsbW
VVVDPALGREPSVPELAAELRVEPAEIANIDLAGDSYHSASLDAVASHDGASIADALGDYDAALAPSLSVSATPEQLPVLRSLVRTVAAHYALSLDGLSDLVLAVDEAATILITHTPPSSTLTCAFDPETDPTAVRVTLSTSTTGQITASTSSFGWHVLEILTDAVVLEQLPPPHQGRTGPPPSP